MKNNRFSHLTSRQKAACYFIMKTLNAYLDENETPEEFLTKYLKKAKMKAGWDDTERKATRYSEPYLNLEYINKNGIEYEKEFELKMYIEQTELLWKD